MTTRVDPIISYADTTLGVVFFNVTPKADPRVVDAVLAASRRRKESPERRQEFAQALAGIVESHHYPLVVHEWAHVLQMVAYPGLYLRCLRELRFINGVLEELRSHAHETSEVPMRVAREWLTTLEISTQPFRVSVTGEGEAKLEPPTRRPMPNDITETDLLEDSASIFQYKVEVGGAGSAASYRRWLAESYRYSKTFDLLADRLGAENAYVALPALVMAAFMTNWPVNGFASLLEMTIEYGPDLPEGMGTDDYWSLLEGAVSGPDVPRADPDPRVHIGAETHHLISREAMLKLIDNWPEHPVTPLARHAWEDEDETRRLHEAMLHPYRAFNRRRRRNEEWLEPYRPPMIAFRVLNPKLSIRDSVGSVAPTLLDGGPGPPGLGWSDWIFELMRIKAFAFSTATPFGRRYAHNCWHRECPYYDHDLCRRWMFIPDDYRECSFPDWLEEVALHRLNFESGRLEPASREGEAYVRAADTN